MPVVNYEDCFMERIIMFLNLHRGFSVVFISLNISSGFDFPVPRYHYIYI